MSAANTAESADFRGPLDITRAATVVLDAESTVIGWSPAAAGLLGYGPAEALGRPLSAFLSVHPVGGIPPAEAADEAEASGAPELPGAPGTTEVPRTTAAGIGPPSLVGNEIHVAHTRDGRELLVATATCPLPGGAADRGPGAPDRILVAAEVGELRYWESRLALLQGLATQSPVGLAIYDTDLRLTWCNTAYEREIGQPLAAFRGMRADELYSSGSFVTPGYPQTLDGVMHQVIDTGEPVLDLNFRGQPPSDPGRDHLWSCAYYRLEDAHGHVFGVCEDAFDITDRYRVQERLTLLVEAGRRIGTVLDVATTAEEIADVAVPDFAATVRVDVTRAAVTGETAAVGSPADMSLLRVADRSEPGTATPDPGQPGLGLPDPDPALPDPDPDQPDPGPPDESGAASPGDDDRHPYPPVVYPPGSPQHRSLSSGGLVLDEGTLVVPLRAGGGILGLVTFDRGVGPDASGRPPAPDRATTFDNGEVALADELAARAAVCIDNARRYTRERTASLALQRQLLPHHLPPQSAVRTAYRYLPADDVTGVGGDWFDVIPLSGTRVGLVVGDVVGHGLQAAATMGRLRTSVRAFAQLDMPPDELLTRLDDLVGQPAEEPPDAYGGAVETYDVTTGATCLYAVYDPVSRRCVMARAGHLPPAIVDPDGGVSFPDLPAGPPLGLGGLPFESMEFELPVGSLLALFTDGLVEARDHDIGHGLDTLGRVLGDRSASLEELCDRAVSELVPGGTSADDTALLLVRTRELDAELVADWELSAEPVSVGRARELATGQLEAWGLDELVFATQLVVSELVTNAVRYAGGPLGLRLIRDRTLVCEVADTGHTSPHLRHSAEDDEGGRGLFIVAQLVQRWGTRYTPTGKTIWTEQALPPDGHG
ncbi:SpoIIE family protein phosphatase [Streptomyces filamentosus]|uniref:SpoIIE family protein phosphatase n=1 Tax=Streptomyces filamentosus TaxID=67294 RepID=A0ABY4UQZ1_STRFL|nr:MULTISPECIES: SpoIIE family protein phosphatase [Streptomyces]ESU46387.1 Serine phosphatase RsbU, regulator of sigma subunit [Streptomyces sp. HCCB10043]EWS95208.1 magnesium or manganese-dependent protein phosphatase [Streptomyces filamentosus NRRL 11379]MYR82200.1 SpoIIE family protein phosphatase [Streptomyces sp. SID5466]USC46359.1 SpoIIE family protein phosphatase [Streptomyces filamentosus]